MHTFKLSLRKFEAMNRCKYGQLCPKLCQLGCADAIWQLPLVHCIQKTKRPAHWNALAMIIRDLKRSVHFFEVEGRAFFDA